MKLKLNKKLMSFTLRNFIIIIIIIIIIKGTENSSTLVAKDA
jgi:hypothetical protein